MTVREIPSSALLVASTSGLSQHLVDARTGRENALCGRPVFTTTVRRTPFEFVGCKRCIRIALDAGATQVQDVDGVFVDLKKSLANP